MPMLAAACSLPLQLGVVGNSPLRPMATCRKRKKESATGTCYADKCGHKLGAEGYLNIPPNSYVVLWKYLRFSPLRYGNILNNP